MSIQVGNRTIGAGHPPFVVAEIGSNWSTFDDCKHSVAMAAQCGADAVKFQAFNYKALYGVIPSWDRGPTRPKENALPLEWLSKLKEKADACGIEFMCSAFSPELIEVVDPYVNIHKNASAELTHVRMLETYRRIGKPVILSTGASGDSDIINALYIVKRQNQGEAPGCHTILLHCVGSYPARIFEAEHINQLKKFDCPVGLSDHTTEAVQTARTAVEFGAVVLEKHVNFIGSTGPDAPHSLNTDEFKLYVGAANGTLRTIDRRAGDDPAFTMRHNRRMIAITDIPAGGMLTEGENFGIFRSLKDDTKALAPWLIDVVNGRIAKNAILAGDGIGPNDVG